MLLAVWGLFMFMASEVRAELKIDSVYPRLGVLGQDLEVTVTGAGFDEHTRVSMYSNTVSRKADTPSSDLGVAMSDNAAYVANFGNGLQITDISDPENPVMIASVNTPGYAWGVAVTEDTAYITWNYHTSGPGGGLQIINIKEPENPVTVGSVDIPKVSL